MSILTQSHFHNEAAAIARLEAIVWPNGPICPHCGGVDRITPVKGGRIGLRRCGDCKKQFSCKVGTVFEDSKVPVHKWFQAAHLLASSKKGISSHQLHRTLGVTYKTAWFMAHRLARGHARYAQRPAWRQRQDRRGGRNLFREQKGLPSGSGRRPQDGGHEPCRARRLNPIRRDGSRDRRAPSRRSSAATCTTKAGS